MSIKPQPRSNRALQKAIKIMGGVSALARALGVSAQAVSQWDRCPSAKRAGEIEAATDGRVTRLDLMPEIFGPPKPQPRKANGKA